MAPKKLALFEQWKGKKKTGAAGKNQGSADLKCGLPEWQR
jgi:hypothetical protein